MDNLKRVLSLILAVLLLVAVMAGCSTSNKEPASASSPAITQGSSTQAPIPAPSYAIKMSYQSAPQQALPTRNNIENGVFAKYGVKVQDTIPIYTAGAPQLEAQPGGEWNIALIGYTAAIRAALTYNMEIIGMCGFDTGDCVLVREDNDVYKSGAGQIDGYPNIYGNADNWRGKTIIVTLGTTRDVCLQLVLGTMGLTYDDVTILNMDNEAGRTAFASGQADMWCPTSDAGVNERIAHPEYRKVADISDVEMAMCNTIIVDKEWAKENEDAIVAFIAAYIESTLFCGNTEANEDALVKYYKDVYLEEFGVTYSDEQAIGVIGIVKWADLELFESFYTKEADGHTVFQNYMGRFFDGHEMVGLAKAEDRDAVLAACNTTYLEKAIELYRTTNGLA